MRLFRGRSFACRRCGTTIAWPGICDDCESDLRQGATITLRDRLVAAGVPGAYAAWRWSSLPRPPKVKLAEIRAWRGEPPVAVVAGPVGTGKTGLTVCLAADWIEEGLRVRWLAWSTLADRLRALEAAGEAYAEVHRLIAFPGLLVLDDALGRRETDYSEARLLDILDGRLREAKPILVTTNAQPPTFGCQDERLASRLASGLVVGWTGPDRRRR